MITKILVPESINRRTSASGKNFMSICAEDGEFYQVWEPKIFRFFSEKKPVKVEIKKIKEFNNVIAISGQVNQKELKELKELKENKKEQEFDERAKGMARGACFNKACDITIAIYQKGEITQKDIIGEIKKHFEELNKILS